jgi:hypothetical protein
MSACICRAGGGPRRWCCCGGFQVFVVFDHLKDVADDGEQLAAQVRCCHTPWLLVSSGRRTRSLGEARRAAVGERHGPSHRHGAEVVIDYARGEPPRRECR